MTTVYGKITLQNNTHAVIKSDIDDLRHLEIIAIFFEENRALGYKSLIECADYRDHSRQPPDFSEVGPEYSINKDDPDPEDQQADMQETEEKIEAALLSPTVERKRTNKGIFKRSDPDKLGKSPFAVLDVLRKKMDAQGYVKKSQNEISHATFPHVTPGSVNYAIKRLQDLGYIKLVNNGGYGDSALIEVLPKGKDYVHKPNFILVSDTAAA